MKKRNPFKCLLAGSVLLLLFITHSGCGSKEKEPEKVINNNGMTTLDSTQMHATDTTKNKKKVDW